MSYQHNLILCSDNLYTNLDQIGQEKMLGPIWIKSVHNPERHNPVRVFIEDLT